ncbi:RuBisCO-associated protein [Spatholobus suberectus]|nr:RuBisCO-associated protein [Spatholobus suberectus]
MLDNYFLPIVENQPASRHGQTVPKLHPQETDISSNSKIIEPPLNLHHHPNNLLHVLKTPLHHTTVIKDIHKNVEIQVALTFARDYDDKNNPTQGKFSPFWDRAKVTPEKITSFKTKYPSAKVLVSIGNDGKDRVFPFKVDEDRRDEWVRNATESLKDIINFYKLDGIDVNYKDIDVRPAIFGRCIGELIKNLKECQVIIEASISPNADKNDDYYYPLYLEYKDYIDNVVYQCFTGPVERIRAIVMQYDAKKVLLGYSSIPEDWTPVSPPVFFIVLHSLLRSVQINGASLKVKLCSIANLPPKWILDVLSFFFNPGPFKL